jgi:hypothetical protein
MAAKQVPLSIVVRTVDKATAGINAINKRLDALTKPVRDFGKALSDLSEKSGLNQVIGGFKDVGGAIKGLLSKVAVVGGAIAVAVHGVLGLVEEFDNLGDTAEKLGVTVDFLAAMRFAAERSGASIESLDQGLTAFGANMGQLRGGSGRMLKALQQWAPALIPMLKATKGNEAGFRLLAEAMSKITDPQKRLALAQKTLGDTALVPLLAKGPAGLRELQGEFAGAAGSLEEAAAAAGKADDALKNMKAATTGVKAAIVTGLAPALTIVIEKLTKWFVEHREDVKRWATEIGEKLPGAVEKVVKAIKDAVAWATAMVDKFGGVKNVLIAIAAIQLAPLVSALATLVVGIGRVAVAGRIAAASLGIGLGSVLIAVAAITAGIIAATKAWEFLDKSTGERSGRASDLLKEGKLDAIDAVVSRGADEGLDAIDTVIHQAPVNQNRQPVVILPRQSFTETAAKITVDFTNAPKGMRATTDPKNTADVDLTVGHQLSFAP